ncbi:MAG: tetratricopeptide repeat protein [Myxococcota bacterium]
MMAALVALLALQAPPARAQTGEGRDLALEALRMEFERDGRTGTTEQLAGMFAQACNRGYNLACRHSTWQTDGRPDPHKAEAVFTPSCEAGDEVACLVMGWSLDAIAQTQTPDDRDRTWRRAARQLKESCDDGFQPACHDYAEYLLHNKGVVSDPAPALRRWRTACDKGYWPSCATLSELYLSGEAGVKPSEATSRALADKACDGGYAQGCFLLGQFDDAHWPVDRLDKFYGALCDEGHRESCWRLARFYHDGIFKEPTEGRLEGLFERGCDLRQPRSCFEAGRWKLDHGGDVSAAAQRFGKACSLGDSAGCSAQVDLILSGQASGGVREAFAAFDTACEARQSVQACSQLAYALLAGVEVPRDAERGRKLLERVCVGESSDPEACTALGRAYEEGLGVERDRTEASKYYRWACASGRIDACERRGDLLVSDVGVRRDDHEALNMYERACEGGIARACTEAGSILYIATFVKQDLARAAELFGKGCEGGHAHGCYGLGQVQERGVGGTPDMAAARASYEKAIALGSLEAKRALARLLWNGYGGHKSKGRAKQLSREACQSGDAVACRGPAFL